MNHIMRFQHALNFTHPHESGTNTDPVDRGGITKYGISEKQYPNVDIFNLTLEDANAIYIRDYWLFNSCDKVKPNLDVVLFDTSVNCGQSSAAQWLQWSLKILKEDVIVDGIIGSITLEKVAGQDTKLLIDGIIAHRLERYNYLIKRYPQQIKYIRGWIKRASDLLKYAMLY